MKQHGYGFSHELKKDDPRRKKYAKQRKNRGFDDTETWSLSCSFAKFAIPRLKRFKKINNGHPPDLTERKWNHILDSIIEGFEEVLVEESAMEHDPSKIRRGMKLFAKYYMALWW